MLLIIDIQSRIIDAMRNKELLIENALKLIKGMKVLNVPIYHTEQYPKGLGETITEIKGELNSEAVHKMTFSCSGAGELFRELINKNISQVIVCGVESHVCVQQTVLDLISNGFQVNVAADAVTSRKKIDYELALNRMQFNGAEITSTESILLEVLDICGTPGFKEVIKIVK
jgi:nicotinamidase-related amidase